MAAVSDIFSLGSIVWCRTCYNAEVEGEVLAFEPQNKMLILRTLPLLEWIASPSGTHTYDDNNGSKLPLQPLEVTPLRTKELDSSSTTSFECASSNGDPKLNDIQFMNLSLVSELQVKKENNCYYDVPQSLNLQRLNTRIRNQVEEKKRMLQAISANVSTEGQSLFIALSKMINEVRWRNSDIIIWNQEVVISPPYQLENVRGNTSSSGYKYILKVVEKHLQDLTLNPQNPGIGQNNRSSQ